MKRIMAVAVGVAFLHLAVAAASARDPIGLFLTWQRDPATTMTIDWHTAGEAEHETAVEYRAAGSDEWRSAAGDQRAFPYSERIVHRVELTDLSAGSSYEFRLPGYERVYSFRTLPLDEQEPIVFAIGGDTRHRQGWMEQTNRVAMQHDPDFMVWGGDLAYADGREDRVRNWYEWFDAIRNTLIAADGRVVPVILGIGNHEVLRGSFRRHEDYEQTDEWRERIAPYFYQLFAFPGQPGYGAIDLGDRLSFVILDSNHSNPVAGAQTEWLAQALAEREHIRHVFPVYHVPAYPSVRGFGGAVSRQIRELWAPLFDQHGVRFAFENHDHAYKRTVPIRGGEAHPDGIIYVGDGAWGVNTRDVHDVDATWYLEVAQSIRHAVIVRIDGGDVQLTVVSEDGDVIDAYPPRDGE